MNQTDIDFFEAYKHLDALCGDCLSCRNGISEYIAEMENLPQGYRLVSNWDSDYKNLKHIRWVRNQIAHDTSDYPHSDHSDLEFAKSFYTRIMNQEDPLAQLRKEEQRRRRASASNISSKHVSSNDMPRDAADNSGTKQFAVVMWIIAMAFFLMLLFLLPR